METMPNDLGIELKCPCDYALGVASNHELVILRGRHRLHPDIGLVREERSGDKAYNTEQLRLIESGQYMTGYSTSIHHFWL